MSVLRQAPRTEFYSFPADSIRVVSWIHLTLSITAHAMTGSVLDLRPSLNREHAIQFHRPVRASSQGVCGRPEFQGTGSELRVGQQHDQIMVLHRSVNDQSRVEHTVLNSRSSRPLILQKARSRSPNKLGPNTTAAEVRRCQNDQSRPRQPQNPLRRLPGPLRTPLDDPNGFSEAPSPRHVFGKFEKSTLAQGLPEIARNP